MKLFYSTIFVFFIQSCILYGMETGILYLPQTFDAGILSSVRQLAQDFNADLKREYISYTGLRKDFEQRNKALLDQVSIDSLQKYLIDLPLEDSDDSAPWLVNYWYDRVQDPHLIQSLSKKLMFENIRERSKQDFSQDSSYEMQDFVVDLDANTGNSDASEPVISDVSKLALLVKKYAYSVKEMCACNSISMIRSPEPLKGALFTLARDTDTLFIQDAFLRTLDGIEDVINKKMTDEEKRFIRFVYFDDNKLHFPDTKRIKHLFSHLEKISYKNNPLRYIDEKDFDMPVGFELDFRSTHHFVHLPIERLSAISYLKILFNKKNLTGEQIAFLQSLRYGSDRGYYFKRNGLLELLCIGFLTNGMGVSVGAIGMALYGSFEYAYSLSLVVPFSIMLTATIGSESIGKGRGLCSYSLPYAEHEIILSE